MGDKDKTKVQLIEELEALRLRMTELQKYEDEYHAVFNQARDGIVLIDIADGRILNCNPEFERQSGRKLEQLRKMRIWEIRPPEKIEAARKKFFEVRDKGFGSSMYLEYQKPDGKVVPIEFWAKKVEIGGSQFIMSMTRDMATFRSIEQELKGLYQRYLLFFQNCNDGLAIIDFLGDVPGKYLEVNDVLCNMMGYTRDELLELAPLEDITAPEMVEAVREKITRMSLATDKGLIFENIYITKEGRRIPVEVNVRVVELNGRPIIFGVYRDITERKRVEEELRKSEQRFRAIFDNATDGIVLVEIESKKLYAANKALCQMLGYSQEEIKNLRVMDIHCEEDLPRVVEQFEKQVKKEITVAKDIPVKRKDDSIFYADISSTTVILAGETYLLAIFRDTTERRRMEQKLKSQYEKEVRLRQELEQQMNQRIEFTRALVHELKTPLTPMLCNSKILTDIIDDETALSLANNIFRAATNLNTRIDELLDLVRGEIGMLNLEYHWIDPAKLLNEVAMEFSSRAQLNKQIFHIDIEGNLPLIQADGDRLRQIVLNLLDNAFKFTGEGTKIILRAKFIDSQLEVKVEDTGPGIEHIEQKRIFESYYRLNKNFTKSGGLGLGLALCKNLVELHRGRIWVSSNKPRGSVFGFSIPAKYNPDTT